MTGFYLLQDVNGKLVTVTTGALMECLTQGEFVVMGIPLDAIAAFRNEYLKRGGLLPITPDNIRNTFNY